MGRLAGIGWCFSLIPGRAGSMIPFFPAFATPDVIISRQISSPELLGTPPVRALAPPEPQKHKGWLFSCFFFCGQGPPPPPPWAPLI